VIGKGKVCEEINQRSDNKKILSGLIPAAKYLCILKTYFKFEE